jgi:hypothetical protein
MIEDELRVRIRELIASGALPRKHPVIERLAQDQERRTRTGTPIAGGRAHLAGGRTKIVVSRTPLKVPCSICGEEGPQTSYLYPSGRPSGQVIRVHAACDALWKEERT